jgi:hypothetical protein
MNEDRTTSTGDYGRSLRDAITSHPLPAALIGGGLIWLLTGSRSSMKASLAAADEKARYLKATGIETASRFAQPYRDSARAKARRDHEPVSAHYAQRSSFEAAPQAFSTARKGIAVLIDRQPLMLGAIGFGVGAAMAAIFRSTEIETDLLGQTSAGVQARTGELGRAVIGQAVDVADRVTTAVVNEARTQGLAPENLQQTAREVRSKVESVAGRAADRLKGNRD